MRRTSGNKVIAALSVTLPREHHPRINYRIEVEQEGFMWKAFVRFAGSKEKYYLEGSESADWTDSLRKLLSSLNFEVLDAT